MNSAKSVAGKKESGRRSEVKSRGADVVTIGKMYNVGKKHSNKVYHLNKFFLRKEPSVGWGNQVVGKVYDEGGGSYKNRRLKSRRTGKGIPLTCVKAR